MICDEVKTDLVETSSKAMNKRIATVTTEMEGDLLWGNLSFSSLP